MASLWGTGWGGRGAGVGWQLAGQCTHRGGGGGVRTSGRQRLGIGWAPWRGGGTPLPMHPWGRVWHKALVSDCLPLAAPIGLSPLLILTLCGPERGCVNGVGGRGKCSFGGHP